MNMVLTKRKPTLATCPLPNICVLNPVTHNTWDDGRYTTYDISIQTRHKAFSLSRTTICRRYSEFSWLRKQLKSQHSCRKPPELPSKKFFFQNFSDEFIQKRQYGLEVFLNKLIAEPLFLSDTVLHLFLQTDLSVNEMNDFINGRLAEDFITNLWAIGGKKKIQSTPQRNPQLSVTVSATEQEECDNLSASVLSSSNEEASNCSSDGEEKSKGDKSIDSGVNVSHVSEPSEVTVPDFCLLNKRFPTKLRSTSRFSINSIDDENSDSP